MNECLIDEIHRMTDPEVGSRWISRREPRGASPYPPMTQSHVFVFGIINDNVYYKYESDLQTKGLDAPTCCATINHFLAGFYRHRHRQK